MTASENSGQKRLIGKRRFWSRCAATGILSGCAVMAVGPPGSVAKEKPPFPDVRIRGFAHGEQAIQELADKLPVLANWHGKQAADLIAFFRHDPSLWVSPTGRLLYTCAMEKPPADAAGTSSAAPTVIPSETFAPDQTFKLHSSPGSNRVIYLDFDGQVVSGTGWNDGFSNGTDIVALPFDLDGSPSTFNTAELQIIQNIWKRVAEDYSPFDVDVTTEEPTVDAMTRSDSADMTYGNRVIITPTNYFAPGNGGISFVGVFDMETEYYKTSWVFSDALSNSEKYIAEACSHENGHSLNLLHDGLTGGTEYYQGQGSWAPIMGNPYYREVTQWSKGEYSGANNTEDQLQIMQDFGLAYYNDDHGDTAADANVLVGATSIAGSGFIERSTDTDAFKFATGAGSISISFNPAPVGADLDIRAELRDSNWNLLVSSDPSGLGAQISRTVARGDYYLLVTGTGAGNPATTGYSKYASLGQYTFTGTIINPAAPTPPVAVASATPTSGAHPSWYSFSAPVPWTTGALRLIHGTSATVPRNQTHPTPVIPTCRPGTISRP